MKLDFGATVAFSPLENVTVIMMTRNRPVHAALVSKYYLSRPENKLHLCIADGSEQSWCSFFRSQLHEAGDLLSYISLPTASYTERLAAAIQRVVTPFVALSADDDVQLLSGLVSATTQLTRDKGTASAGGAATICRPWGSTIAYASWQNYGFGRKDSHRTKDWQDLSLNQSSVNARAEKALAMPLHHRFYYYRLVRREVIQDFLSLTSAISLDTGLGELCFALASVLRGHVIVTSTPYLVRSSISYRGLGVDLGNFSRHDASALMSRFLMLAAMEDGGISGDEGKRLRESAVALLANNSKLHESFVRYTRDSTFIAQDDSLKEVAARIAGDLRSRAIRLSPRKAALLSQKVGSGYHISEDDQKLCGFPSNTCSLEVKEDLFNVNLVMQELHKTSLQESYKPL